MSETVTGLGARLKSAAALYSAEAGDVDLYGHELP